jgi:hypothetical protein
MNDLAQNDQPSGEQSPEIAPQPPGDQQPPSAEPPRKFKLTWPFAAGFLGWYLLMALFYGIMLRDTDSESLLICGGGAFFLQVIVLIIFLLSKDLRDMGWGMLSALGVNLLISLVLGSFANAICFIPFFADLKL